MKSREILKQKIFYFENCDALEHDSQNFTYEYEGEKYIVGLEDIGKTNKIIVAGYENNHSLTRTFFHMIIKDMQKLYGKNIKFVIHTVTKILVTET